MKIESPPSLKDLETKITDLASSLQDLKSGLDEKPKSAPPKQDQQAAPECPYGAPQPGEIYIIRDTSAFRAMAIEHCQLVMADEPRDECNNDIIQCDRSFHWLCVCTKGWLGFQNVVTDTFLGTNPGDKSKLGASMKKHQDWEFIVPRPHPKGGYQILCRHDNDLHLMGVQENKSQIGRIEHGKENLYRFVKVGGAPARANK